MARLSFAIFSMLAHLGFAAIMVNSNTTIMVKSNATRNSCETCKGWACCCETTCGQVGSGHVSYDPWSGTYWGGVEDNGHGHAVTYVEHAAKECSRVLRPLFDARIKPQFPCCLYTGQTGLDWGAKQKSCNVLEKQTKVADLLMEPDKVGGPNKVKKCPGVKFPTNFWETLSQEWARYLNSNINCHDKIFLLLPNSTKMTSSDLAKKISIRIELAALKTKTKVIVITDDSCRELHRKVCETPETRGFRDYSIRDVLADKEVHCVRVRNVEDFRSMSPAFFDPDHTHYPHTRMNCKFPKKQHLNLTKGQKAAQCGVMGNKYAPGGDQCNWDELVKCMTAALECGVGVASAIATDSADVDTPVSELDPVQECPQAAEACADIKQSYPHFKCKGGDTFCHTDFCATCCSPETSQCATNDWGAACARTHPVCKCAGGNSNSCCSKLKPGTGMNTGSFCGNDFHVGACNDPKYPWCCTNDVGIPSCCAKKHLCNSGDTGNPSCIAPSSSYPEPCTSD